MRLFVALDIAEDVRARLGALLDELRRSNRDVRWVKPEALHVTLKFLGEQPEDKLSYITEALAAVRQAGRFEMALRGLGCFPNERRPRVFWVGVNAPAQIGTLAAAVDEAMAALGIARERRAFSAHLTLGRARDDGPPPAPGPLWQQHLSDDFGPTATNEFFLYQSKLSPGGAQYTRLRAFPL